MSISGASAGRFIRACSEARTISLSIGGPPVPLLLLEARLMSGPIGLSLRRFTVLFADESSPNCGSDAPPRRPSVSAAGCV